jgi:hypothetical protein
MFDDGKCKHYSHLYFYMPGCQGVGLIELTFTSVYSYIEIPQTLDMVQRGLGHISGTHNGQPIFWLSKVKRKLSKNDYENEKSERVEQYIISIEARGLDMAAVFAQQEMDQPRLAAPPAVAALSAPEQQEDAVAYVADGVRNRDFSGNGEREDEPEPVQQRDEQQPAVDIKAMRHQANALATELQVNVEVFAAKQAADFGADWSKDAGSLEKVIKRLEGAKATGDFSELVAPAETKGAPF